MKYASDIAFSETVKAIQTRKGSRMMYQRIEESGSWDTKFTPQIANYISQQRSMFFGTSNSDNQPYIQYRGGPKGFLKVLDSTTLAFADYKGNKQFISQGNLNDNDKAFIFLIDYANQTRVKLWGTAKIIEDDDELTQKSMQFEQSYRAKAEQVVVFNLHAFDINCPQHIPQKVDFSDVEKIINDQRGYIQKLEKKLKLHVVK